MLESFDPSGALIPQENTLYTGIISTSMKTEYVYDSYICGLISGEKKNIDIGKENNSYLALREYNNQQIKVTKREVWLFNSGSSTTASDTKEIKPHKIHEELVSKHKNHPWIDKLTPFNLFRSRPVFMAPSHITIKTLAKVLLKQGVTLTTNAISEDVSEMTIEEVYNKFMADITRSEKANNILDFEFESETTSQAESSQTLYEPRHTFFQFFQDNGGVKRLFSVAIQCVSLWDN
jgi:hypothetical protein